MPPKVLATAGAIHEILAAPLRIRKMGKSGCLARFAIIGRGIVLTNAADR
jgi:hypothetical protein